MWLDQTNEFQAVQTDSAPRAIGPYSQATVVVSHCRMVFLSGQVGLDPANARLVRGGVVEQTHQVMLNLQAVLAAAGSSLRDVVRTTIYLKNLEDFSAVNAVYAGHLDAPYPARATVEVARLPLDALVEIDAIAVVPPRG